MENCSSIVFRHLNRIKNTEQIKQDLTIQDLSSSALGVNILKYINIEGIIQIDLLKVVQRDHKLDSYKLEQALQPLPWDLISNPEIFRRI